MISILLIGILMAPAFAFDDTDYYKLLYQFSKVLSLPQNTPEQREVVRAQLADQFTLFGPNNEDKSIAGRAKFMWISRTGYENWDGSRGDNIGSAGTRPSRGYYPRMIDLYANWRLANLQENEEKRHQAYLAVIQAFPPGVRPDDPKQYFYKLPQLFALHADARFQTNDHVEEALKEWQQDEAKWRGQPFTVYLAPDRETSTLNTTDINVIAKALNTDYQRIKRDIPAALQLIIPAAFTQIQLDMQNPTGPVITGTYAVTGKVPVAVWAQDQRDRMIGDVRHIEPGDAFVIPLNNLIDEQGTAVLCWSLRDQDVAKFLTIPAANRVPAAQFTYQVPAELKARMQQQFSVYFAPSARQQVVWVSDNAKPVDANRDPITINYTWNKSSLKGTGFHWRVDSQGNSTPAFTKTFTEKSPTGTLTINPKTLPSGTYSLAVQNDLRNDQFTPMYTFQVTRPAAALVIGIDNYPGDKSLNHACDDAEGILQELQSRGYAADNLIWLLGRGGHKVNKVMVPTEIEIHGLSREAIEACCNGKQILPVPGQLGTVIVKNWYITADLVLEAQKAFRALLKERNPQHALFFYSGHGKAVKGLSTSADLLVTARPVTMTSNTEDPSLLPFADLHKEMKTLGNTVNNTPQFVTLVDACRESYTITTDENMQNQITLGMKDNVLILPIYSCALGQFSIDAGEDTTYNGKPVKHGLFTFALLKGIDDVKAPTPSQAIVDLSVGRVLGTSVSVLEKMVETVNGQLKGQGSNISQQHQTLAIGNTPITSPTVLERLPNLQQAFLLL